MLQVTDQDLIAFLKEYGLGGLQVAAVVAVEWLRARAYLIKAVWKWAGEAKYVAVGIGAVIAAFFTAGAVFIWLRPDKGTAEVIVRHTGLALQLAGTSTVILGAVKTRAAFHLPSLRNKAMQWLKQCPLRSQSGTCEISSCTVTAKVKAVDAYGIRGLSANPTLAEVADALYKNVEDLHKRISALRKEVDGKLEQIDQKLEHAEQSLKKEDEGIRQELKKTATGGLHIVVIGTLWVLLGSLLSTVAPEIQKMLE